MNGSLDIYMAHRVTAGALAAEDPYRKISMTAAQLDAFLTAQKKHKQPLSLSRITRSPILPDGEFFALTFDDGYLDTLTQALPVLERHNVPATIFIGTQFIDGTLEPFEILFDKLLRQTHLPPEQRRKLYAEKVRGFKRGSLERRMDRLARLAEEVGAPLPPVLHDDFLSWRQVGELDAHPLITIGSHATTHTALWKISPHLVYTELMNSKKMLQQKLGHAIDMVSYPYGRQDMITRILSRACGYRRGFTTNPGTIERQIASPYTLPRNDLNGDADYA